MSVDGRAAPALFPGVGAPPPRPRPSASPARRLARRAVDLADRLVAKDEREVVLAGPDDLEDGLLAVAAEGLRRGARVTLLLQDPGRARLVERLGPPGLQTLPVRSVRGLLRYLRARHAFTTGPLYGGRVPAGRLVDLSGEALTSPHRPAGGPVPTYAPVCSTVGRACRSAATGLPPLQAPIVGAPRNDRMLTVDGAGARRALLGADAGRTVLLWAPQPRGPGAAPLHPPADLARLDAWLLAHDARVVVAAHPRDPHAVPTSGLRAVRALLPADLEARGLTLHQALPAFDGLVTDLSGPWLDWLLLDRPVVLALPAGDGVPAEGTTDLEPYEDWVPGPCARTLDELLAALEDVTSGTDRHAQERGLARLRFHAFHDARSAERLLDGLGLGLPPEPAAVR